jgi:hypothetical protein
MRAQEPDEAERAALTDVLTKIENAGKAIAADCGVDLRVESDQRGKLPFVGFRLQGFSPARDSRAEPSRNM